MAALAAERPGCRRSGWVSRCPTRRLALGELARRWREQFSLPLIAVTGSNGKTTVTQMVAAILRAAAGEAAHATQGNFNNDIGVPLTLLRSGRTHRLAVIELGMNHPGEIADLAAMAQPTVALVNNAQREHQEFMGTVDAVARENGAVIAALADDGVAVFPSDDAHTRHLARSGCRAARASTFSDTDTGASVHVQSASWQNSAWDLRFATPAGEAHCAPAHGRTAQRAQRHGRCRLRAGRRRAAGRDRRRACRPSSRSVAARAPWP